MSAVLVQPVRKARAKGSAKPSAYNFELRDDCDVMMKVAPRAH
jgi:hypothetical protein